MFKRNKPLVVAAMALTLPTLAVGDVLFYGSLTLIPPALLLVWVFVGVGGLVALIYQSEKNAVEAIGRADRMTSLTAEQQAFIAALETTNSRLNASEVRYKGLVDIQGDAIVRRTQDGKVTYVNDAFLRIFGVKSDGVMGSLFRPEQHPESPAPVIGRFAGREMGRERVSYDQHVKTIAGYRWIPWEDYAVRDDKGRLIEIQSVGRDVTERKMLEAELTEARDRSDEANRAKSQFLATISHEIRTPMNGVLGMARLLLETELAPDQKAYSEAIHQSGLALLTLIEDLLDFSKIESGTLIIEANDTPLRPLVEGVSELLSTRAHAKGLNIVTSIASDVPEIVCVDAIRLRQILTNLVGNAVKFTDEGGIHISATLERQAASSTLVLSVQDTGIGVSPDQQAKIFEDFVQAGSSHARRFQGTGLGLAISKRLVEAMGGQIGIKNADVRGSVFWVHLPLLGASSQARQAVLAGKRIAVLTSSDVLRDGLKLQLQATGAVMMPYKDLAELRREKRKCDALLLDVSAGDADTIPDVSGLGIPAVVLVPPESRAQVADYAGKGIRGYLTKPVRQVSLETRLVAIISGSGARETKASPKVAERRAGHVALSVLLAEDNPVNALLARELLRRRGHSVHEVTNGEAAVEACVGNRFDVVLMDLHMPGLDGIDAAKRIRSAEAVSATRPVPIYALTADALETGRKACLDAGMDGFLTKPVDPAELDAILASVGKTVASAAA